MSLLKKGDVLGTSKRWEVEGLLGEGKFSEVYEVKRAQKPGQSFALKLERRSRYETVFKEYIVLRKLKYSDLTPTLEDIGTYKNRYYVVTDRFGQNLYCARKDSGNKFSPERCYKAAISTLK